MSHSWSPETPASAWAAADDARLATPVLIGVCGKRDLKGLDEAVREAFEAVFDVIDRRLPHTPRILLSALAAGADTVAAEAALARGWRVVAPLPFRQDIYEQDFAGSEADLARLRGLLAHPGVTATALAPLRRPGQDDAVDDAALARGEAGNRDRSLHYEQVGLHIAERCALLVGVIEPDEAPERIGGTARILDWRLRGADPITQETRARSIELLPENVLDEPRTAPVWRILLDQARAAAGQPLAVTIQTRNAAAQTPLAPGLPLETSLAPLRWTDRLNRRLAKTEAPGVESGDGIERLTRLRTGLSRIQANLKQRTRWALDAIVVSFVAAIVSLEAFIAFGAYDGIDWLTVTYATCAVLAVVVFGFAAAHKWQPLGEDYRAASEALRGQIVLWRAGLASPRDRIDLGYLRSARGALARLRHGIGQMVEAARLTSPRPPEDMAAVEAWIEQQTDYFHRAIQLRHGRVSRTQAISWFLFIVSLTLACCLAAAKGSHAMSWIMEHLVVPGPSPYRLLFGPGLIGLALRLLVPIRLLRDKAGERGASPRRRGVLLAIWAVIACFGGLLIAVALCNIAAMMPPPPKADEHWLEHQAVELVIMGAVVCAATAGAIRFRAEKLSWEAELQGFEQAHGYFSRALVHLRRLRAANDLPAARALVRTLVDEALRENEAWLISHRERPLEPVIGG